MFAGETDASGNEPACRRTVRAPRAAIFAIAGLLVFTVTRCSPGGDEGRTPRAEYTAEDPGEWAAFSESHAPRIQIVRDVLRVDVPLQKIDRSHYIEKIGVMDAQGRDVVPAVAFPREASEKSTVSANLALSELRGDLSAYKVYAKCNLHDLWTAPLETE